IKAVSPKEAKKEVISKEKEKDISLSSKEKKTTPVKIMKKPREIKQKEKKEEYIPTELQKMADSLPLPLPEVLDKTKVTLLEVHPTLLSAYIEINPVEFGLTEREAYVFEVWANGGKLFSGKMPALIGNFDIHLPQDGLMVQGKLFVVSSQKGWKLLYETPSLQMGSQEIHPLPSEPQFISREERVDARSVKLRPSNEKTQKVSIYELQEKPFFEWKGWGKKEPYWKIYPVKEVKIPPHFLPIPEKDFIPWGLYWSRI
ncbi:MAG: hypothetical protein D6785_05665, partial [Planctomycetota bacterium]